MRLYGHDDIYRREGDVVVLFGVSSRLAFRDTRLTGFQKRLWGPLVTRIEMCKGHAPSCGNMEHSTIVTGAVSEAEGLLLHKTGH